MTLVWTKEKPPTSGWWWYRWNGANERIVHLIHAKGDERLYQEDDRGYLHDVEGGSLNEWAGPIELPEEGKEAAI